MWRSAHWISSPHSESRSGSSRPVVKIKRVFLSVLRYACGYGRYWLFLRTRWQRRPYLYGLAFWAPSGVHKVNYIISKISYQRWLFVWNDALVEHLVPASWNMFFFHSVKYLLSFNFKVPLDISVKLDNLADMRLWWRFPEDLHTYSKFILFLVILLSWRISIFTNTAAAAQQETRQGVSVSRYDSTTVR